MASDALRERLRSIIGGQGLVRTAQRLGVSRSTLVAAAGGFDVRPGSLALIEAALATPDRTDGATLGGVYNRAKVA